MEKFDRGRLEKFASKQSLNDLAQIYWTDKGLLEAPECKNWGHNYTSIYEKILPKYKEKEGGKLLEIGIWRGNSLRMWRDYFPGYKIYGVDDNRSIDCHIDDCFSDYDRERITYFTGDERNELFMNAVGMKHGDFDIIIDDGDHAPEVQIKVCKNMWKYLADGGIYIIEDVCEGEDIQLFNKSLPGMVYRMVPLGGNVEGVLIVIYKEKFI